MIQYILTDKAVSYLVHKENNDVRRELAVSFGKTKRQITEWVTRNEPNNPLTTRAACEIISNSSELDKSLIYRMPDDIT